MLTRLLALFGPPRTCLHCNLRVTRGRWCSTEHALAWREHYQARAASK